MAARDLELQACRTLELGYWNLMIDRVRCVVKDAAVMVHFPHGRWEQKDTRTSGIRAVMDTLDREMRVQRLAISTTTCPGLAQNRSTRRK